ncbi:clpB protein [Klebsiella michiganensis]|nr:clpB protein [Klebsiella michiganensis]
MKGEFEQRLKNIIDAVQQSPLPVLLFIDEAHTLIGAGNQAGGADAANLLKPALARGELRTIAATTWSEYKQYFERDAALERRFQMIKVDEPDDDTACLMLRGLKSRYAEHHGVHITDEAVRAAVTLSRRYLTGRQLPDKAVDLLDTASARIRMSMDTVPAPLTRLKAQLTALAMEKQALLEDYRGGQPHPRRTPGGHRTGRSPYYPAARRAGNAVWPGAEAHGKPARLPRRYLPPRGNRGPAKPA